jgi:hypothetical protein
MTDSAGIVRAQEMLVVKASKSALGGVRKMRSGRVWWPESVCVVEVARPNSD